jgi:cytochrome P450
MGDVVTTLRRETWRDGMSPYEDTPIGPPRWELLPEGFPAWRITRYADVRAVLSHTRLTRDERRAAAVRAEAGLVALPDRSVGRGTTVLDCDPPTHTALRGLVNFGFLPRRIVQLRPWVEQRALALVESFRGRGAAELCGEFALPLTAAGMCRLMGLPTDDLQRFGPWVREVHGIDPTPEGGRRIVEAVEAMDDYIQEAIKARRGEPGEGLLAELVTESDQGTGLAEDDLVAMVRSILVGGYESTAALVVTGVLHLLTRPGQLALLRARPDMVPAAVEEALRFDPPFRRLQVRYPVEDVELGGVRIPRGEPIVADLAAANRDPERFAHPDTVDITDVDRGHLAFGPGIHHCLGVALARMEADVALRTLLDRLPGLELECPPQDLEWPTGVLNGPSTLPVRFTP